MREQERRSAHPRAGERGLGPGVATAHHYHLIPRSEYHDCIDVLLFYLIAATFVSGA
jgi:hypothetical protein